MKIIILLQTISCIIQAYGAYTMYQNSPLNKPEGAWMGPNTGSDLEQVAKSNKNLKQGFGILFVGLLLQIAFSIISIFIN